MIRSGLSGGGANSGPFSEESDHNSFYGSDQDTVFVVKFWIRTRFSEGLDPDPTLLKGRSG